MESELVELFEAAKKAADAAAAEDSGSVEEESRCLEALKELKDFPVNYQILVSTQVLSTSFLLLVPNFQVATFLNSVAIIC